MSMRAALDETAVISSKPSILPSYEERFLRGEHTLTCKSSGACIAVIPSIGCMGYASCLIAAGEWDAQIYLSDHM